MVAACPATDGMKTQVLATAPARTRQVVGARKVMNCVQGATVLNTPVENQKRMEPTTRKRFLN